MIDHTTISEFRHRFGSQFRDIGAQMAVIAHQMSVTTLTKLAQDGTRLRASNQTEPPPPSKSSTNYRLHSTKNRAAAIERAKAEIERAKAAEETIPKRDSPGRISADRR